MTTPSDPTESNNVYFMDPESGAEMARLMVQDQLVTKGMGGLLAERSDLSSLHRILDIACGPGGWALEVAYAYPKIEVVGIDISQTMIEYAQAQAQVQGLDNATFKVMDVLHPLGFPNNSFDVVNARLIGFLPPASWPGLLQEFLRITRPGGVIRLTEWELSFTTSFAFQRIQGLFTSALKKAEQSFSPDGHLIGMFPMLGRFLREAGCQHIQHQAHIIDWSTGTDAHQGFAQDFMIGAKLSQPFQVSLKVETQQVLDQLYEQFLQEVQADDFSAVIVLLTAWGEKPS